ncbi:hypothetical protein [Paraburkholderia tuberum]|uniref:Uncharacterized protein n=1 Tax=Paraburkholderia tuberum TaxID=157910 RepID=A0A1H1KIA1_9BURK|nr:hypothetical protein [Paraburkholderia tuberum]SDR61505.1 hypothetical protein SAMN05445850_7795 [Paraburkholderia tuberum]
MSLKSQRVREMVRAAAYREAYLIGRKALEESACDDEVIAALRDLTTQLRSNCMDLAARKMDVGPEYDALEKLLREANRLIGEDLYGRKIASPPSQER